MAYGDDQEYPDYLSWLDRIQPPPPPPGKAESPEDPWLGNTIPGSERRSNLGGLSYGTGRDNGVRTGDFMGDTGILYEHHRPSAYPSGSTVNPDGSVSLPGGATRLPPDSAGLALLRPAPVSQSAASIDYGDGVKQKLTPSPYTMPTGNPNAADSRTTKMPDEYGLPTIEEEEDLLKNQEDLRRKRYPDGFLPSDESPYSAGPDLASDGRGYTNKQELEHLGRGTDPADPPPVADPASGPQGMSADLSWLSRIQPPGEDPSGIGPLAQNPSSSQPNGAEENANPFSQPVPDRGPAVRPGAFDPTDLNAANSALEAQLKAMPQRGKPKWWENLAAGALGGAAGWSNRSLPRSPQIDIGQLGQSIRFPGYQGKLQDWQQRLEPLKAQADIEAHKQKNWWDQAAAQSGIDYRAAEAERNRQQAEADKRKYQNNWSEIKTGPNKGGLYNKVTNEIVPPKAVPETPEQTYDRLASAKNADGSPRYTPAEIKEIVYKVKPEKPVAEKNTNEWQLYLDANGGDSAAALKQWRQDKQSMRTPVDPTVEALRQLHLEAGQDKLHEDVDQRKITSERNVMTDRDKEVAALIGKTGLSSEKDLWDNSDAKLKLLEINRKFAPALQNIQDNYAKGVRTRGGQADDYDIDPNTLASKKREAAPVAAPVAAPRPPGPGRGAAGMVTVQIPGQPPTQIPAANVAAFKVKFPNGIVH